MPVTPSSRVDRLWLAAPTYDRRVETPRWCPRALAALLILAGWACAESRPARTPAPPATASGPFLRILGTVQDGGFPHAACEHEACRAARIAEERRYVSSLAVVLPASRKVFLIDATPDLRPQLDLLADVRDPPPDRVDRAPVDGVFLTHAHVGHYLGLAFFGFEAIHTRDLPVWATPRMAGYLRTNGPWSQLVELGNIALRELALGEPVELGEGVSVTAVRSPHRDEYSDTVGFVIAGPEASVFYLPDTDSWDAWDRPLAEVAGEVDVALLDGSFFSLDELPGRDVASIGHPLIRDSMARLGDLATSGRTRVVFIHLNHSNPALVDGSPERVEIETAGFSIAREGNELPL